MSMPVTPEVDCFDKLPSVIQMTTKCRSAILKEVKEGTFPAPYKTGAKSVAWKRSEVLAWMNSRVKTSAVS